MIGTRAVEGVPALTLTTDDVEATFVPGAGMVGCSLRHKGDELLGQRGGLLSYIEERSTMGIPLLHPWANRIARSRFPVAGGMVDLEHAATLKRDPNGLPMHGLLAAAEGWLVQRHEATDDGGGVLAASFDFAGRGDLMASFPYPHGVLFEASLRSSTLTVATTVVATGETSVPISFGYHPYLRLPGVDRSEWEVEVPVRERLELDERMLPTGRRAPVRVDAGRLSSRTFDDAYLAPMDRAPFVLAGGGRRIELTAGPGYGFAQVYAPPDDDVIAYEPMTAPANALVAGGADLPVLKPGERYTATFSIGIR